MSYRIVKLYRPVIGRRWWLQRGEWLDSDGAHFYATGKGRRTFRVEWEESHPTKGAAEVRLAAFASSSPPALRAAETGEVGR